MKAIKVDRIVACRGCGNTDFQDVLSLGDMPLANALLNLEQLASPEPTYPLEVVFCRTCSLVQITCEIPPDDLFSDYLYFSSNSSTMVDHSRRLVERLISERGLTTDSLAVEIASNDGYLLQHYGRAGVTVLGIEPAKNIAAVAMDRGIDTVAEFFGRELAQRLVADGRRADVIHANNVMAHVPDIHGVLAGIETLLSDDGVAVIETPYVRDLVENLEFDTIYHEHVFYYSLTSMQSLLAQNGLEVTHVEHLPIHGGSLRVFAQRMGSTSPSPAVQAFRDSELARGVTEPDFYLEFAEAVRALGSELVEMLKGLKTRGRKIAAYGAAAKGSVLLNAFHIGGDLIDFVADRSPHKQGMYMPGVHIPVVSPDRILAEMPDDVLLLTWNFAEEILEQQREYVDRGGRFIKPVPRPQVLT